MASLGEDLVESVAYESFRSALAISQDGNIVAVGMSELFQAEQYVTVYEYRYDGIDSTNSNSTWVQLGNEIWSDRRFKNFFGTALSLSSDGKVLAIGSPGASGSGLRERHVGLTTIYRFWDNEEAPQKTQPPIMVNFQYPNFARSRKAGSAGVCIR